MNNIQLFLIIATVALCTSCNQKTSLQVTNANDYAKYLVVKKNKNLEQAKKELNFWKQKLTKNPNQYPYNAKVALANTQIFQAVGTIESLKKAEQNLIIANEKTNYNNAGYLRNLARNYISQHRFKEALILLTKAEYNGEKLNQTHFMLVDVHLELGNYDKVEKYLSKIKNFKDFNYLIRVSKYNDHKGNLEKAIQYLEDALKIAKTSNNTYLTQWNYTNLADYYGHAGRIQDSYDSYLKALAINPNNSYAKKGIAWIVYSYEKNPKEALTILNTVTKENAAPDYHLLKSEIANYMGNLLEKENQIQLYLSKVNNPNYGAMYAKYNAILFAENKTSIQKSIAIAKQEVEDRPTPQSYDLLAWAYYKNGQLKKALSIVLNKVLNNTFEPEVLLHAAYILKANNMQKEAKKLKEELLGAVYELGPTSFSKINNI